MLCMVFVVGFSSLEASKAIAEIESGSYSTGALHDHHSHVHGADEDATHSELHAGDHSHDHSNRVVLPLNNFQVHASTPVGSPDSRMVSFELLPEGRPPNTVSLRT